MHEAALAQAALPAQSVILRLPLRAFSLGHLLRLVRHANPLITMSGDGFNDLPAPAQRTALLWAVAICNQSWRQNQRRHRWLRLWGWTVRNANWPLEIAEFRNYMADGSEDFPAELPRDNEAGVRFIGAPELIRLYQFLGAHLPEREAALYGDTLWDYPLGLARMLMTAYAETEGHMEIYNHRHAEHDKFVAEQEALRKAEEAAAATQPKEATCQP